MINTFEFNGRKSPLQILQPTILAAVYNIAPERSVLLAELINHHKIECKFDDAECFNIRALIDEQNLMLSVRALEFIWASTYFFVISNELYYEAGGQILPKVGPSTNFDPLSHPNWMEASNFMHWSKNNLQGTFDPWTNSWPLPLHNPKPRSDIHLTNELFHCALAWIMHHELGHITLEHGLSVRNLSIAEEFDADKSATDWVLNDATNPDEITKRGYGVIAALMAIRADSYSENGYPKPGKDDYPKPEERIVKCLEHAKIANNDNVKLFAVTSLQLWAKSKDHDLNGTGANLDEILFNMLISSAGVP